jgi:hypothetical protein
MPLQNRVTPTGEIVAVPARGLFMGNRGILHDGNRRLGRSRWKHKAWIICRLCFRGRRRVPMTPRRYTELFFLDEAVAIAAGHRPCFECRRRDFYVWQAAWRDGNGLTALPRAPEMDARLHAQRVLPRGRGLSVWSSSPEDLPDGVFILVDGMPHLLFAGALHLWSHDGYGPPRPVPRESAVTVLTPPDAAGTLRGGYRPVLHGSATGR